VPCVPPLQYDDDAQECLPQSTTCSRLWEKPGERSEKFLVKKGPHACVQTREDCEVRRMGRYQYCKACSMWAMCHPGGIQLVPCPPGLLWDDEYKICRMESSTCKRRDIIIPDHPDDQADEAEAEDDEAEAVDDEAEAEHAKSEAFQFQDVISTRSNVSPDTSFLINNTDACVLNSCEGREVGRYAFCKSCRLYVHSLPTNE